MSNQTTNINIRMDEKLKQQFDVLCNELGMNMTTAFNIFAKAMVRQHGIPFNVTLDIPNETTLAAMDAAVAPGHSRLAYNIKLAPFCQLFFALFLLLFFYFFSLYILFLSRTIYSLNKQKKGASRPMI